MRYPVINRHLEINPEYLAIIESTKVDELIKIWIDVVLGDLYQEWQCSSYVETSIEYDQDISWRSFQPCFEAGVKRFNGAKIPILRWWNFNDGYVTSRDWRHSEIYVHEILKCLPEKGFPKSYSAKNIQALINWFNPN